MKTTHDSETPQQGQQVITACACIYRINNANHEIFLARRAKTKKFYPDTFELIGGHIEYGEPIVDGLLREIREELHLDAIVEEPVHVFDYLNPIKSTHSVQITYLARFVDEHPDIVLNPEDHSEYRWIAEQHIPALFSDGKPESDKEWDAIRAAFSRLRNRTA
ncbi:MAG: hypothetical protein RI911_222 [Candidatus Parcubacteria bacterium]|jgi:8-oxo-dGTP pyrophosphatase MutT (NUDIX family)